MALTKVTSAVIKDATITDADIGSTLTTAITGSFTSVSSSIATRFDSRESDMTLATASIAAITSSISRLDDTESNMTLATASIAAITASISRLDTEAETNESNMTLATASIAAITASLGQPVNTDSDVTFGTVSSGDITSTGTITAVEVHTTFVSSSIAVISGSNNFGDATDDHHSFTGSLSVSGSLTATGSATVDGTLTVGGTIDFNSGTIDLSTQTVDVTLNGAVDALNFDSNTLSIDATNNRVGIGTASPVSALTVVGGTYAGWFSKDDTTPTGTPDGETDDLVIGSVETAETGIQFFGSNGNHIYFGDASSSTIGRIDYAHHDNSLRLFTNSTQAMHIDSSGNVGIGNSSLESWHANDTALQIGSACSIWAKSSGEADGRISISQNAYKDASTGNMQRFLNDQASVYFQDGGRHFFYVAGAAGADADITWTSALTIANNGDTTVNAGDLIMGTAGKGISFANAADTATGETVRSSILDDYEEGYGNFIVKEGTNVIDTGSNNVLVYVRVGKMVYICGYIIIESDATVGTGAVTIAGLPYVMDNATSAGRNWCNFQVTEQGATGFSTTGNYVYGYANYGESFMNLRQSVFDGTEVAGLVGSELAQSMQIRVSGTYIAA